MTGLARITGAHLALMILAAALLVLGTSSDLLRIPYGAQLLAAAGLGLAALPLLLHRFGAVALAALAGGLLLFGLIALVSVDVSHDGMRYHLPAALEIREGRNVIFDQGSSLWSNIYPSGSWRLMAYALAAFEPINPGVILNGLAVTSLFLLALTLLSEDRLQAGRALPREIPIQAALIACSPVMVGQFLSGMVDGLVCTLFLMLALLLIRRPHHLFGPRITTLAIVALAVLLGSVKSSSLFFLTVLFCGALACELARSERRQARATLVTGLVAAALVLFGNIRPYATHVFEYGTLLPDSGMILGNLMPKNIENGSHLSDLAHLVFGVTGPISCCDLPAQLKIPFTFTWQELDSADTDPRTGGFGPFFSGTLVLAAVFLAIYRPGPLSRLQKDLFVVAAICTAAVVLFPEPWWARLVPMLAPALLLLFLALSGRVPAALRAVFLGVCALNTAVFAANAALTEVWMHRQLRSELAAGEAGGPLAEARARSSRYDAAVRHVLQRMGD
ncbi:hypothetical protein ORIO_19560 (plasmid) [Cereibacter azotoformans]|uniref:hypothetical protein n=1 Tax=Cereibacter azotoformans TaxID=43057 RepID=UPI001EEB3578|nr:hypothetical protein [Cereibacter azotoformans]ULB12021.1 hypothetical protein ORIO_19560 [Cereibacter azotoformans]